MVAATQLMQGHAVRAMLTGYPGAGKTGALACLANAGFKLRILDYDGNLEPLLQYTRPECLHNIDIISLEDELRGGLKTMETVGLPTAFADGLKAMDRWRYKDPVTGEDVDLGKSKEWGPDHVVVLDSLTAMGKASMRRVEAMTNKTPLNRTDGTWGTAMAEQDAFIEKLTSSRNRFHVIVTAHLKMIGPKDLRQGDSDLTKEIKERQAELVPTRLFPSALGRALPPEIGGHFPTLLLVECEHKGSKTRRVIRTLPRPELDVKVPAPNLPSELDIEDGLLRIFDKLTGGVAKCLQASA